MILFMSLIVAGIQQVEPLVVATFAKASAWSFSGIPTWAGIQTSDFFALFLNLWNSRKNSINIGVIIGIVAFFQVHQRTQAVSEYD